MKYYKDKSLLLDNALYRIFLSLILFLSLGFKAVNADELDNLLANLKTAPDEVSARKIENAVWEQWLMSGDQSIDAMIRDAMRRRSSYDFDGALEVLNQVIAIKPEYPEVWNQRATVYFHRQEYEKSLQDVAKALELEPRHFGAMAGRGVIRYFQGKPALAAQNILQAAEYHPYLKELQMFGLPYPAIQE
ncbi:MAG: tetratricopeptide repeat protein [Gammaproteobacteria bacterium]|nr:tetratricopeptide repeat protein [Gammaproteobacteria bacterium]